MNGSQESGLAFYKRRATSTILPTVPAQGLPSQHTFRSSISRGFVKEDDQEEAPFVPPRASLPDGVTNYVTPRGMRLLLEERSQLEQQRATTTGSDDERRRAKAEIDGRLALLNERIVTARPVEHTAEPPEEVRFGARVTVMHRSGAQQGTERVFTIVGVDEASVAEQRYAFTAPIARALIGKRRGEREAARSDGAASAADAEARDAIASRLPSARALVSMLYTNLSMKRSWIIVAAQLLAGKVLLAQPAFTHQLMDTGLGAMVCRSMTPVGGGTYRLLGTAAGNVVGLDLHADGSVSNAYSVPMDTNQVSYPVMVLPTSDGGHLFAYFWVADGTNKWVFLKTDAAGAVQWNRYYPDNYGLLIDPQSRMVEKDGHYFALAHLQAVPPSEGWASVLLELDETGALVANRRFAGGDSWSEPAHALLRNSDNGLTTVCVLRPFFSQASFPQISVQRWNADLSLAWSKHYSLGNYHLLRSVNQLADGGLVFTGSVRLLNSGPFLPFIFKIDAQGAVVWSRRTQGSTPVLQDVVEESDGSLLAVGSDAGVDRVIARLDSAGALVAAWRSSGSLGLPAELLRDSLTDEHLVRFTTPPMIMRLDAGLLIDCQQEALSWSDTLVAPAVTDEPVTLSTADMLLSFDSLITSQPLAVSTMDPCLSTPIAFEEHTPAVEVWPVPTRGPLHLRASGAGDGPVECTVLDAAGRGVRSLRTSAAMGVVNADLSALADGPYVIVLRYGATAHRVVVLTQ